MGIRERNEAANEAREDVFVTDQREHGAAGHGHGHEALAALEVSAVAAHVVELREELAARDVLPEGEEIDLFVGLANGPRACP